MRGIGSVKKWLALGAISILVALAAFLIIVTILLSLGWALDYFSNNNSDKASWEQIYKNRKSTETPPPSAGSTSSPQASPRPAAAQTVQLTPIPFPSGTASNNSIAVDFTSQAPFGVWDYLHEETCEEAAVVMAYAWTNSISLTPEFVEKEILKLVDWQKSNLGSFENTSAKDMARIASEVYGLKTTLIQDPSIEDIKIEILRGNIVVMGMAGKKLQNPYFKAPGPVYHALLFRGFDDKGFFVNDPGTRRGNNFYYTFENITESAHDWNGSEEGLLGSPPIAIVFSKTAQ